LMCEEAHRHGSLAGVELWHGGPTSEGSASREIPGAPSQIPSDLNQLSYPRELDRAGIRELESLYAAAARRARDAGFDIVYVYGAHSFLPLQFLSSFYNKRTDEYGGPLPNRARFWLETLELVREAVGDECAIAARLAVDARGPNGIELEEGLEFVSLADHLVDLWDVNIGEGRLDEIRECIGCNVCLARALDHHQIACTQNPTAGEEFRRGWHPERFERSANADRDVLVVGAGAAGMECALVLGKRGMSR